MIRLSESEIQYILENANKKSIKEIAEWIGCHVNVIYYQLKKNNISTVQFSKWSPKMKDEMLSMYRMGYKPDVIGKHFNMSGQAVRNQIMIMKRHGIDVTVEENSSDNNDCESSLNDSIVLMFKNGLKLKIIAKKLDISVYTVRKRLKDLKYTKADITVPEISCD